MAAEEILKQALYSELIIDSSLSSLAQSLKLLRLKVEFMSNGVASDTSTIRTLKLLHEDMHACISRIRTAINNRDKARKLINESGAPEYRNLLELRYLYSVPWEEIAKRLDCSERIVHLLHDAALDDLDCNLEMEKEDAELNTELPWQEKSREGFFHA